MKYSLNFLFIIVVLFSNKSLAQTLQVVDEDNFPIPSACVFDKEGVILGITDTDGKFDLNLASHYPLVIKTAGMEDAVVEKPTDKVTMKFRFIELPDVTFSPKDRPVLHILAYAKEMVSCILGKDTATVVNEYMVDYFIALEKCKFKSILKPRFRNVRKNYIKPLKEEYKALANYYENHSPVRILAFPSETIEEPESLIGQKTGSEQTLSKYGYAEKSFKKTPVSFLYQVDWLAKHKDHNFIIGFSSVYGFSMTFTKENLTYIYPNEGSRLHRIQDLAEMVTHFSTTIKGRRVKNILNPHDSFVIESYSEYYPVSKTFLSVEDAKVAAKDTSKIEFVIPEAAKK